MLFTLFDMSCNFLHMGMIDGTSYVFSHTSVFLCSLIMIGVRLEMIRMEIKYTNQASTCLV